LAEITNKTGIHADDVYYVIDKFKLIQKGGSQICCDKEVLNKIMDCVGRRYREVEPKFIQWIPHIIK